MPKFYGKHWMLPLNVDCHKGTILKRCWNVCECDPTKFKPHASCMYFGSIPSYVDGSKVRKNASKVPWRWAHDLTSWLGIFEMFPDNLQKMHENANIDWVTHLELDWE
jgi:hypothetical protein